MSEELEAIAEGLMQHLGQVICEDFAGNRFRLTRAFVIGARTDDPGLVLRVVPG